MDTKRLDNVISARTQWGRASCFSFAILLLLTTMNKMAYSSCPLHIYFFQSGAFIYKITYKIKSYHQSISWDSAQNWPRYDPFFDNAEQNLIAIQTFHTFDRRNKMLGMGSKTPPDYRMRVTAGSEYDIETHRVVPVNSEKALHIESDDAVIYLSVRIQDYTGEPNGSKKRIETEETGIDWYVFFFFFLGQVFPTVLLRQANTFCIRFTNQINTRYPLFSSPKEI